MKSTLIAVLLLATIAGQGQTLEHFYRRSDSAVRQNPTYYTAAHHATKLIGSDGKGNYLAEKCDTCSTWIVYDPSKLADYLDSFEMKSSRQVWLTERIMYAAIEVMKCVPSISWTKKQWDHYNKLIDEFGKACNRRNAF